MFFCFSGYIAWWRHQMETFSSLLSLSHGIHRSAVDSPLKGQWRRALMFSFIWTNGWTTNRNAADLRRHSAHYDVTLMGFPNESFGSIHSYLPSFFIGSWAVAIVRLQLCQWSNPEDLGWNQLIPNQNKCNKDRITYCLSDPLTFGCCFCQRFAEFLNTSVRTNAVL